MRYFKRTSVFFALFVLAFAGFGCFDGFVDGGGGSIGSERKLSGVYQSDTGKVIVFYENGAYQLYFKLSEFRARADADSESEYTVIGKDIVFKDDSGREIPERGILDDQDLSFTWEKYPGETFVKQQN